MEVKCSSFPPYPHSVVPIDETNSVRTTVQQPYASECDVVVFVFSELSAVLCGQLLK